MARVSIREVLVGFVVDVIEPVLAADLVDLAQRGFAVHRSGGVVGGDRNHGSRLGGDRLADGGGPELVAIIGVRQDRVATRHGNGHLVVEVVGGLQNDFVAQIGDGQKRVDEGQVGAGRHHYRAPRIDAHAVLGAQLRRERLDQERDPLHGPVLVVLRVGEKCADLVDRFLGRAIVDHPLPQGNGAGIVPDQRRDTRDDRRLNRLHP
jgi:hypothetical protein